MDNEVSAAPTMLDAVLDRLTGRGVPAHRVWLPPLDEPPALGDLLAAHGSGRLRVPIGLVDNAFGQRHEP